VLKIPVVDALGVTVVLLTCSYRQQEFVRVGYFINNEYTEPELRENPPAQPQFDKVGIALQVTTQRQIASIWNIRFHRNLEMQHTLSDCCSVCVVKAAKTIT
jgi:uncharacterized protein YneF (UPF0154 family)